ncbi:unnamed protein product [Psylliodes chrysocephalus]|uniref:Uncharacterized protein n=1 Tax=Psylliodes chrysocephalus TaxID=3402493 RepID=A0A9P0D0L7_9CUCU|nr:unnamed protein product [Psylliodes chrysocephala]
MNNARTRKIFSLLQTKTPLEEALDHDVIFDTTSCGQNKTNFEKTMNATDSTADTKEITILQNVVIVCESKTLKIKENNVDYSIIESKNSEEQPKNREPVTETINCPTTNRISEDVNLFETIDDDDPDYIPKSENEESKMGEMDKEEISNVYHPEQCNKITPRPLKKLTKKEERVKLRNTGVKYVNSKGRTMPSKKVLGNPCLGKKCLNMCVSVKNVKRHTKSKGQVTRTISNEYSQHKGNTKVRVCQQFLLKTLNISQRIIRSMILENTDLEKFHTPDKRGHYTPHNKASSEQVEIFKKFVESLPAVPSYYCRSCSTKKYLPSDVKSFNNLYKIFVEKYSKNSTFPPLKRSWFLKHLKTDYNIGIHVPRKDKCSKCETFNNLGDTKTKENVKEYEKHIQEKDAAKKIYLQEQAMSGKEDLLVVSFDLQKVLATPHGDSMLLGFSRKYAVYNFTTYESGTQRGICYIWGEKDAKRGPNEIASNLFHYLQKVDNEGRFKSLQLQKNLQIKIFGTKRLTFTKDNAVVYTSSFLEEQNKSVQLTIQAKSRLLPCYKGELPIAKNKYKNLKSLCDSLTIRKEFHHEYLLLKTSNTVADVLEETDDEDEI